MAPTLEELDYQKTPLGELVLRRRRSPSVPDDWVYEVTLDHEMLMSSTVNVSERSLARLALQRWGERPCDVLVGGLGLGYTAVAALEHPNVQRVVVVELLAPVIAWHRHRMVPMAGTLIDDPRCCIVEGDFFAHVETEASTRPERYDVILLDIDHSPDCLLQDRHAAFYGAAGLRDLADCLRSGGIFGLWSAWRPSAEFLDALATVFPSVHYHEVGFFNPHISDTDSNWITLAEAVQPEECRRQIQ